MHLGAYCAVAEFLQTLDVPTRVLEIGALNINGSIRPLFAGAERYCGIDVVPGPGVDVVASGATYQPDFVPDCVVCCEVLEHTPDAERIVRHMVDLVAPGGSVIVTCASEGRAPHSAVDGMAVRDGEFYRNVPAADLHGWLHEAGLTDITVQPRPDRGDVYAVGVKP